MSFASAYRLSFLHKQGEKELIHPTYSYSTKIRHMLWDTKISSFDIDHKEFKTRKEYTMLYKIFIIE